MKLDFNAEGVGDVCITEMTIGGMPAIVRLLPHQKHPERDVIGAAAVYVGYMGARVRWPNGRETKAHIIEHIWEPTWDSIAAALQRCCEEMRVAMREVGVDEVPPPGVYR